MSDVKAIVDTAILNEHVADVIEEQTGNLTQLLMHKKKAKRAAAQLAAFARQAAEGSLRGAVPKPDPRIKGWKRKHANRIDTSLKESDIDTLIKTTHERMRASGVLSELFTRAEDSFPHEGFYYKIAYYIGQVSWMIRHGLDPELLVLSEEEGRAHLLRMADALSKAGVPTATIIRPASERKRSGN